MNFIKEVIFTILHIQDHLSILALQYGKLIYFILFAIIFCETGLIVMPFLPGDSLLLIVGMLTTKKIGYLNLYWLILFLSIAAISGNICNYLIGKWVGKKLIRNSKSFFLKQHYLQKTYIFYEKYGGKTIILTRFIPIIRTFAPFVAGIVQMKYIRFFIYNTLGGFIWIGLLLYIGYTLGRFSFFQNHFGEILLLIIFISLIPAIVEIYKKIKLK